MKPWNVSSALNHDVPLEKPPIYTTESGSQYVRAADVIRSKAGWAEIQRLKEADLVRRRILTSDDNSSRSTEKN